MIRCFLLIRDEDETGVSGTGVVAAGMEFPDRHVIMRWLTETASSVTWDSMEKLKKVHGHNGRTRVVDVYQLNPSAPSGLNAQFTSYVNWKPLSERHPEHFGLRMS